MIRRNITAATRLADAIGSISTTHRRVRRLDAFYLFVACAALLIASCTNADEQATDSSLARVVKVIDGDTLVVSVQDQIEIIRLIGVDTPETVHPTKGVECFGPEASRFTKSVLKKGAVDRCRHARNCAPDKGRRMLWTRGVTVHKIGAQEGRGREIGARQRTP